jgi:tetratricopeptide (TPR) repeat protein
MSTDSQTSQIHPAPPITTDPRYRAARRLITSGRSADGAIEMLATLVEEARSKYGEDSINAAAVYYEYGNSLFRAVEKRKADEMEIMGEDTDKTIGPNHDPKSPAAAAAEKRAAAAEESRSLQLDKTKTMVGEKDSQDSKDAASARNPSGQSDTTDKDSPNQSDQRDITDEELALELMENAFAIYDQHYGEAFDKDGNKKKNSQSSDAGARSFVSWMEEQLPRVLGGIGDVLSALGRYSDAVDAYTRKARHHEDALRDLGDDKGGEGVEEIGMDFLRARRLLCEANILVAESLLRCPIGEDAILSETGDVLVQANELLDYAQGYYDQARDELQETVYIMGRMAPRTEGGVPDEESKEFAMEKENVCFCAQMLGGVGNMLAERNEEEDKSGDIDGPNAKKPRINDD